MGNCCAGFNRTGFNLPTWFGTRVGTTEAEWDAERTSWSSNNAAGAFASPLKLPVAGYRIYSSGSLSGVGFYGLYWSSTVGSIYSRYLQFDNGLATMDIFRRAYGFSVRCLKD